MVWRWQSTVVTGGEAQAEEIINSTFKAREEYVNRKFDGGLDKRDFERLYNMRNAVRAGLYSEDC